MDPENKSGPASGSKNDDNETKKIEEVNENNTETVDKQVAEKAAALIRKSSKLYLRHLDTMPVSQMYALSDKIDETIAEFKQDGQTTDAIMAGIQNCMEIKKVVQAMIAEYWSFRQRLTNNIIKKQENKH